MNSARTPLPREHQRAGGGQGRGGHLTAQHQGEDDEDRAGHREQKGGDQDVGAVDPGDRTAGTGQRHHRRRDEGVVQPLGKGDHDQDHREMPELDDAEKARGGDAADESEAADEALVGE
jgi:hypothetical protein